jgi:hypothetical protein
LWGRVASDMTALTVSGLTPPDTKGMTRDGSDTPPLRFKLRRVLPDIVWRTIGLRDGEGRRSDERVPEYRIYRRSQDTGILHVCGEDYGAANRYRRLCHKYVISDPHLRIVAGSGNFRRGKPNW